MAASDKNKKQVMDVSKPGKTPASASSRPVIVGHKPQVQDPMMTTEETKDETPETSETTPEVSSPALSKKVITPLSEADKDADEPAEDEPTEEASEEPEQVSEAAEEPDEKQAAPVTEEAEEPKTPEPEDSTDSAVVDAVIDQVGDKKQDEIEAEEERKRQETIEKLVAEKKYFVPIGKAHKKSNQISLVLTLLLFVVLVGIFVAIDAEVLDAGFKLPFDVIKSP
jgi:hypothetical protein